MALNIKTLGTRALTALIFVLVLLGSLLWNYYSFTLFFFLVAMFGLYEFYNLGANFDAKPYRFSGYLSGALTYLVFVDTGYCGLADGNDFNFKTILVLIPFLIFSVALFNKREKSIVNSVYTIIGIIYAVLPFALLHNIVLFKNSSEFDPTYLLGIILLIWSNDTFAYLGGSIFGKHKMIARISPGKTWEGTIFGIIMTTGSAYIVGAFILHRDLNFWMLSGIIVPVLATIGDLVESMLKRQAGVKDTGNIMPGHGGILDRFDSLIFVSPFVFVMMKLIS